MKFREQYNISDESFASKGVQVVISNLKQYYFALVGL